MNRQLNSNQQELMRIKIMIHDISAIYTSHPKRRGLLKSVILKMEEQKGMLNQMARLSLQQCQYYVECAMNERYCNTHAEVRVLLVLANERIDKCITESGNDYEINDIPF